MMAPLLTKKQVAAIMAMHPASVMRLVRANKFPEPFRTSGSGGAVRWRAEDVEAWIATRSRHGVADTAFEMLGGIDRAKLWVETASSEEIETLLNTLRDAAAVKSKGDKS